MKMLTNKLLVVAAHPDDDILGCGGFLSRYSSSIEVRVIFIGEGSSCRYGSLDSESDEIKEAIKLRTGYAIKSLESLGIEDYSFYDLPCGRLDTIPVIEINKIIEKEILEFNPDTVFTHSDLDLNNDHRIIFSSVMMATRPGAFEALKSVFSFEVLSSSEWRYTESFSPNVFIPLREIDIENKWKALSCYKSEIREYPHPRSYEGLKVLASYRGLQSNNYYAEAFRLQRSVI